MGSGEVSLEDSWSRGMWDVVCWFCIVLDDLGAVRLAQNGPFWGPFRGGTEQLFQKPEYSGQDRKLVWPLSNEPLVKIDA